MSDTGNIVPFPITNMGSIAEKLSSGQSISVREELHVYETINRKWRSYLTITEFCLLSFVIDRSLYAGKDFLASTVREMLDGTDDWCGAGISRSTYFRACIKLEAKGFIKRMPVRRGTVIVVNLRWTPDWLLDHPEFPLLAHEDQEDQ